MTQLGHDLDGNLARIDEPGAAANPTAAVARKITERTYDGRGLLWTETTGSGDAQRTVVHEFDPNGNPRRVVNPAGVSEATKRPVLADDSFHHSELPDANNPGRGPSASATKHATVREYSPDNLLIGVHLPWGDLDARDQQRWRENVTRDGIGRIRSIDAPYEWSSAALPAEVGRTSYTYFDNGWIRSASDPTLRPPDKPVYEHAVEYDYDRQGNQTKWRSTNAPGGGETRRLTTRTYWPNGLLRERKAGGSSTDCAAVRCYQYFYNENKSLTRMVDVGLSRTTYRVYDAAEREVAVDEAWGGSGADRGRDTAIAYDRNGNPEWRKTDGTLSDRNDPTTYQGGKETRFSFDDRDQELTTTADPVQGATRVYTTSYWPSGEVRRRERSNGRAERLYFDDAGRLARMIRDGGGATAKDQAYGYDRNGNRTSDERGTHIYNARDQLVRWTRKPGVLGGSSVSYEVNGSGAVTKKTDGATGGGTLTYSYVAGTSQRLDYTVFDPAGIGPDVRSDYSYDPLGQVTRIHSDDGITPDTTYEYDEFERLRRSTGPGTSDNDTTYCYDGLDRRDRRAVRKPGTGTGVFDCSLADDSSFRLYDYSYVGSSERLSREYAPADGATQGQERLYDYSSGAERLGFAKKDDGATTPSWRAYATDALGSVEEIESSNGTVGSGDRYQYDPYGELLKPDGTSGTEIELEGALSAEAKANPFRFQGFYYDAAVKTYDLHARAYRPAVPGYLTQDRYEAAYADLGLQTDPLTQNRYAFVGGNPVNRIEFDGHYAGNEGAAQRAMQGSRSPRGRRRVRRAEITIPGARGQVGIYPTVRTGSGQAGFGDAASTGSGYAEPPGRPPPGRPLCSPASTGGGAMCPPHTARTLSITPPSARCLAPGRRLGRCHQWQQPREASAIDYALMFVPLPTTATIRAALATRAAAKTTNKAAKARTGDAERMLASMSKDGKTSGVLDIDGELIPLTSGKSTLQNYAASGHVEGQAALIMRERGVSGARLLIDNPNGICGYCTSQVPTLLPEGAQLLVRTPLGTVRPSARWSYSRMFTGNASTPKSWPR